MQSINSKISISQADNYHADLQTIRCISPNIEKNCDLFYDYLSALIQYHVLSIINT